MNFATTEFIYHFGNRAHDMPLKGEHASPPLLGEENNEHLGLIQVRGISVVDGFHDCGVCASL